MNSIVSKTIVSNISDERMDELCENGDLIDNGLRTQVEAANEFIGKLDIEMEYRGPFSQAHIRPKGAGDGLPPSVIDLDVYFSTRTIETLRWTEDARNRNQRPRLCRCEKSRQYKGHVH
jgi:hypothetical protein